MVKCDDYWCEHNGKSTGNCDNCIKKEISAEKSDFRAILQKRAFQQIKLDKESSANIAYNISKQER